MDHNEYKIYTFVRNPYTRFQSMYNWLIIMGKISDTPLTFATNILYGKYEWAFTHPMCYFCKRRDLTDLGRLESFNTDADRIFKIPSKNLTQVNKTQRPSIYETYPQLKNIVTRLYFEDFIEFGYEMETPVYKTISCPWMIKDLTLIEYQKLEEYESSGSIYDKIPLRNPTVTFEE